MKKNHLSLVLLVVLTFALIFAVPVTATKTVERSFSDSLTRGSRFTVTITGLPNSSYYIWLPGTFTMTGLSGDQPPVIANSLANVEKDPTGGPYIIGSYRYNNGDGRTIRDDVAPTSPDMSDTNYYALVTTDNDGRAVVEFQTSVDTGLRSYSVKVENPKSVDTDNLLVGIQVYNRRAPTVMVLTRETTPGPVVITQVPTVIIITPLPTEVTTMLIPPPTAIPVQTTKAAAEYFPITCAAMAIAICTRSGR
jgi:hypothetical protein